MALQPDGPAPYTSPSSVIQLVEGFRNRGLQTPFTADVLIKSGVSDGLAPRTLQALKQLDLIDEAGEPTPELRALQRASSEEFKPRFAELIRSAYAPIFAFADPATDPSERVRDAFRGYVPIGQQGRMVTLFVGLCEYAEIVTGVAPKRATTPKPHATRGPRGPRPERGGEQVRPSPGQPTFRAAGLRPSLAGLLSELPPEGSTWTSNDKKRFLTTFEAVLDFAIPVDDLPGGDGIDPTGG